MRITTRKINPETGAVDPDFLRQSGGATVRLDGVEIRNCVAADSDAGTVEVFIMDEAGLRIPTENDSFQTDIRNGVVEIEIPVMVQQEEMSSDEQPPDMRTMLLI